MQQEINGKKYMLNANGGWDPVELISDVTYLRDEMVEDVIAQAEELKREADGRRSRMWNRVQEFLELSASSYGVKWGGAKGNLRLINYNGLKMVQVAVGEFRGVNEGIHSAKQLVDEVLSELTEKEGVPPVLRMIVNDFFRVNQEGKVDFNLLYKMKKWKIDDPNWKKAMEAIDNSIEVIGSSRYLRFYTRSNTDARWEMIPMDFSRLSS